MLELKEVDFDKLIADSDKPVIVDFWAPWCRYCTAIAPAFEELAAERSDIVFAKVNVDEAQGLAERFQVMTIPTLLPFRGGVAGERLVAPGSREKIEEWLREVGV